VIVVSRRSLYSHRVRRDTFLQIASNTQQTMTDDKFSPEDSLRLIQSMIEKTKEDFAQNAFFYLLWGWLIFITALSQYVLMVIVRYPHHYLVWLLMIIGGIISIIYGIRYKREERVKTYMSESMSLFGIGTGISFSILPLIFSYNEAWQFAFPVYLVLYGFCSFVSGAILRFKPLRWAAAICWAIAVVSVYTTYQNQLLLMALSVLTAYIVPGYLLRAKNKKQTA
jgi:Flp pilus assembly protein TadB